MSLSGAFILEQGTCDALGKNTVRGVVRVIGLCNPAGVQRGAGAG